MLQGHQVRQVVEHGREHEPFAALITGFRLTEELTGDFPVAVFKKHLVNETMQVGMACACDTGDLYYAFPTLSGIDGTDTGV